MNRGDVVMISTLLVLAGITITGCSPKVPPPPRNIAPTPAPTFELKDLKGNTLSSETLRGKIVLIHFCASWSPSSAREVQQLSVLQEKYRSQGVQVVGIALEEGDGSDMHAFAERSPFNYPVLLAPANFHREFGGIEAIPTTFVISPDWVMLNKHTGMISPEFLEAEINLMLKEAKDAGKVLMEPTTN